VEGHLYNGKVKSLNSLNGLFEYSFVFVGVVSRPTLQINFNFFEIGLITFTRLIGDLFAVFKQAIFMSR
jgi:hypothetical protein